jgi:hypothetical protein
LAPKYVISTPIIEEQKKYMRDYVLVGKFLGLWPSERELVKWIHHWWNPKGNYDLQLGSKGFFTIILHNLEDQNHIFDGDLTSSTQPTSFYASGWRSLAQRKRTLRMPWYGYTYTPCHKSFG